MTERQRVEKTCEKVHKKHPDITDKTEIRKLALRSEQRRTLWTSIGLLWASIACMLLYILVPDSNYTGTIIAASLVFFIVCSFEYFRTVLNASKIKYHFLPEHNKVKKQGTLTYELIKKKKRVSSIKNDTFKIIKATLYDKDDADNSFVSLIYHKYNLYFKLDEDFTTASLRVKRRVYLKSPLDAEYILVLSDDGKVISAYLSKAWQIDSNLFDFCDFDANEHNNMPDTPCESVLKKNKLPLEILICFISVVIYILPIIIGVIALPFTTFFATKFAVANKTPLSVINIILGYLGVILVFLTFCLL